MTSFGISASYWRVEFHMINARDKEASFTLKLFFDKNATTPVDEYVVSELVGMEDKTLYEKYFGVGNKDFINWQTACYMYAKDNIEFFKDAIPDEEVV